MTKDVNIPKAQAVLLFNAQQDINRAQANLDLIATTITAGLDVQGRVVKVDTDAGVLTLEVPDEA